MALSLGKRAELDCGGVSERGHSTNRSARCQGKVQLRKPRGTKVRLKPALRGTKVRQMLCSHEGTMTTKKHEEPCRIFVYFVGLVPS